MNVNKGYKHLSNECMCVYCRLVNRLIDEQMGQNVKNILTTGEIG